MTQLSPGITTDDGLSGLAAPASVEQVPTDSAPADPAPVDHAAERRVTIISRVLGAYLCVVTLLALVSAVMIWPGVENVTDAAGEVAGAGSGVSPDRVSISILPGMAAMLSPGQAVILFAAVMGVSGGGLAGLRALAHHRSKGSFDVNYGWWYIVRPLIGAGLAIVVYMVLRAGLVGAAPTTVLNAFGVGAVAALSGLFAQNVLERLNRVIEALLGTSG